MANPARKATVRKRTASKEERREQLIRATIRSVAKNGLSDTTMASVSGEAGLSQGIINLHFQSKDRLLVETLRYLDDEYRQVWLAALDKADSSSAERLATLIEVDFTRPICDRNKIAVWFAYWGESKSRPVYRKICAERDNEYNEMLTGLCSDIVAEGLYTRIKAESVAVGLSAMTNGLWLDILVQPNSTTPAGAQQICMDYLANTFPSHFGSK